MAKRTSIHGFWVNYEDNAHEALKRLRDDLSRDEAKVYFEQARLKGSAQFEDDYDRQFTLFYERGSGSFILTRR